MAPSTSPDPTIKKANDLFRMLSNGAAWERGSTEGINVARSLALLIQNHELQVEVAPSGADTKKGAPVVQTVHVHNNVSVHEIAGDLMMSAPMRCDGHPMGIVTTVSFFMLRLSSAMRQTNSSRLSEIKKATDDLVATLTAGLKPGILNDRKGELWGEIYELFEKEPEQPGAAKIAKKLGRRTDDVRKFLANSIKNGSIEATGTTRNRRYRRVVDSSPE